jgi:hypothetical protein
LQQEADEMSEDALQWSTSSEPIFRDQQLDSAEEASSYLPKYRFQVVDSANKPLSAARWAIYQGDKVYRGSLDSTGWNNEFESGWQSFDGSRRFKLHVEGYVCMIERGATLISNDPEVEYGGQFLDWSLADAESLEKRAAFWQDYNLERMNQGDGVFLLIQHDHVMRRPIKLLAGEAQAVFQARPVAIRLGPIVRYVDEHRALIWLELATPGLIRVRYGKAPAAAGQNQIPPLGSPDPELQRHSTSVRVGGRHYALVLLDQLDPDSVYLYTIEIAPIPAASPIPTTEAEFTEEIFPRVLPAAVQSSQESTLKKCSFRGDRWLFFRTLRSDFESLRFAHGSCRKWPNDGGIDKLGPDMLEYFGSEWLARKYTWAEWPRFFLHTGDQIYADDIGIATGKTILRHRFGSVVPGPAPRSANDIAFGAWSGRFGFRYIPLAKNGSRAKQDSADLARLRPDINDRQFERKNRVIDDAIRARKQAANIFSREFVDRQLPRRFKLQVLNGLLWTIPIFESGIPLIQKALGLQTRDENRIDYPSAGEIDGVHAADYAEYSELYELAWRTTHARKVLAHVPSFMIFDDHDVTDDWNGDREWLKIIHSKSDPLQLWPATITDALCAYWIYQGWGNVAPEEWSADARIQVLERSRRAGRDALPELRRLILSRAVQPTATNGDRTKKLSWNYSLPIRSPRFLVLDLRTDADVNGTTGLSRERVDWLERNLLQAQTPASFIVLPTPYLLPDPLLFVFRHPDFTATLDSALSTTEFRRGSDVEHAAGNAVWDDIKLLLTKLQKSANTKTLGIISGDVHFSCNFDGQLPKSARAPRFVQLISSGLRQQISESKQKKLISSYRGWLNVVSGSEGVDTHRGIKITLGGLRGRENAMKNFHFEPSVALVDVKSTKAPGDVTVPAIAQVILSWNEQARRLDWFSFLHMTEPNGTALMTIEDPGMKHPARVTAYPKGEILGTIEQVEQLSDTKAEEDDFVPAEDTDVDAENLFSLPKDSLKTPDDGSLRTGLQKMGTKEARAVERALNFVGNRTEFEKALVEALKAVPLAGEGLNKFQVHLARLGAEAFTLDIGIDGQKRFHIGFVDHPAHLDQALSSSSKEYFLQFALKRLLDISATASTPETHKRQMEHAVALFRVFQSELSREFRLLIESENLLLAYRSLLARVIWKHYQALFDQLLAEAKGSVRRFQEIPKQLDNHLRTASITLLDDKQTIVPAFRTNVKSRIFRDYFNPSAAHMGFSYFTKAPRKRNDSPQISFRVAHRRRVEQRLFLEHLAKRSEPEQPPSLHDSASWQTWIRKIWDRPLLQRVDKLTEILDLVSWYFDAFTAHVPYDLLEGCAEKNYMTRTFPQSITGSLIHDCAVYAIRWIHMLGRIIAPGSTPPDIENPRIFLIEMPSHLGVMIRAETQFKRHIVVSINNTQARVHQGFDTHDENETTVGAVVQDMYHGMKTPCFIRPIGSSPADAKALWNEVCKMFERKLSLPYPDSSEPHLRYLAFNAGIARISRELADTIGGLWFAFQQKLDGAKNKSGVITAVQFSDELQRYCRSVENVVKAASADYDKDVKPLIDEINSDLSINKHRLPKGAVVVETSEKITPWVSGWTKYRSEIEKALKSRDMSALNPEEFFRYSDFRASID